MVVNNPRTGASPRTSSIQGIISAVDASVRFNHCPLRCLSSASDNRSRCRCLRVNTSQRSSVTRPARLPIGVNRLSALSILRCSRNSAREVNIRYGSSAPFVIRSSIKIPVYPSIRPTITGSRPPRLAVAFRPAINPWQPASSYPDVPLICPARYSPGIDFTSSV